MQKLKTKITSLILIILLTFSTSYNMLSFGYEVLAAPTGNVEVVSNNGIFKMILPATAISDEITENSMPLSEWQNLINKYETYYYNAKVIMNGTDNKQVTITYENSELTSTGGMLETLSIPKTITYGNRALRAIINRRNTIYSDLVHEIDHLFQEPTESMTLKHVIVYFILIEQLPASADEYYTDSSGLETVRRRATYTDTEQGKSAEASLKLYSQNSSGTMQAIRSYYAGSTQNADTFYEAMKTYAGIDIDQITLSNEQTIYKWIGGTQTHNENFTIYLNQGSTQLVVNNTLTGNKLDWLSTETIAYEVTNLNGATITLTGHVQDNGIFRKIEGEEPNIDSNGNEVAYLKIVKDGKELLNLAIPVENEKQDEGDLTFNLNQGDIAIIKNSKKTGERLDWNNDEALDLSSSDEETLQELANAKISLTGYNFKMTSDGFTFEKDPEQDPEVINGDTYAVLTIARSGKAPIKIQIPVETEEKLEEGFYYKIGVEDAMPLSKDEQIEVEVGEVIQISYVEEDISETMLQVGSSYISGHYIDGKTVYTFRYTGTGKSEVKLNSNKIAEFIVKAKVDRTKKVETEEKIIEIEDTLYLFNYENKGKDKAEIGSVDATANTDRPYTSTKMGGEIGGTDNWLIKGTELNYYCFDHGDGIKFDAGSYFYRYRLHSEIELTKKQQLILAYLKNVPTEEASKISGVALSGEDWREHLIQYYIWSELQEGNRSDISYGTLEGFMKKILTFTNDKNEYIDIENEIVTFGEKEHKLTAFAAFKYIVNAKYYSSTGEAKWTNKTDEGMQPIFTFVCELKEKEEKINMPYIQKIDAKTNETLAGAVFEVYNYDETRDYDQTETEDKESVLQTITTNKSEKIAINKIPLNKKGSYIVIEKTAPEGYEITTEYGILTVAPEANEPLTLKVKKATHTGVNGEAIPYVQDTDVENSKVWEIWELDSSETDEDGEIIYTIIVKDKKEEKTDIPYIQKIDETTNEILAGAIFEVYNYDETKDYNQSKERESVLQTITTKKGDKIAIDKIPLNQKGSYIVIEKTAPEGYEITTEYGILTVDPNANEPLTLKAKKATHTGENGEAIPYAQDKEVENSKVWEIWELDSSETDENGEIIYTLIVKDKKEEIKPKEVELQINKINGSNDQALESVGFTLELIGGKGINQTTNSEGKTDTIKLKDLLGKDIELEKTYEIKITETAVPEGFTKLENPIIVYIHTHEDGTVQYEMENQNNAAAMVSSSIKDETLSIVLTVKNYPEQVQNLEVPLLMNLEGTVWLDMTQGKNGKENGLLDNNDVVQNGVLVKLFEEDGVTPAEIVKAKDLEKAIQNIKDLQAKGQNSIKGNTKPVVPGIEKIDLSNIMNKPVDDLKKLKDAGAESLKEYINTLLRDVENGKYTGVTFSKDVAEQIQIFCDMYKIEFVYIQNANDIEDKNDERYKKAINDVHSSSSPSGTTITSSRVLIPDNVTIGGTETSGRNYVSNIESVVKSLYSPRTANKDYKGYNPITALNDYYNINTNADADTSVNSVYEDLVSSDTMQKLEEHKNMLSKYGSNIMVTDKDGKFYFYGLNPNKKYKLQFIYNGLIYENVEYNVTAGATFTDKKIAINNSKAVEDKASRDIVTNTFKEIGSYPNNYNSPSRGTYNKVFKPEEFIKMTNEEILRAYNGTAQTEMEFFIKDSMVKANTPEAIGGILKEAEKEVVEANKAADSKNNITNEVYPVVVKKSSGGYDKFEEAVTEGSKLVSTEGNKIIGYYAYEKETYKTYWEERVEHGKSPGYHTNPPYKHNESSMERVSQSSFIYKNYNESAKYELGFIYNLGECGQLVNREIYNGKVYEEYCSIIGPIVGMHWSLDKTTAGLELFEIQEGYRTVEKTVEGGEVPMLFGNFLMDAEPYFSSNDKAKGYYDNYISNNGVKLPEANAFYNIAGIKVTTNYGWGIKEDRTKAKICYDLISGIDNQEKQMGMSNINFGIKFRPVMDLGIKDTVYSSEITINQKTVDYYYNERAADEETFKFGVNEYDITNRNISEENYEEFKKYLAQKNVPDGYNSNEIKDGEYESHIRKYDVDKPRAIEDQGNGIGVAGNYGTYNVAIKLRYAINLYNQAGTKAKITEIVDYYDPEFKFAGAEIKGTKISASQTRYKENGTAIDKLAKVYIPVNLELEAGASETLYIDFIMEFQNTNPNQALVNALDKEGYKVFNYAEINGYSTVEGYLDFDSIPGNIKENLQKQKEDDEGKSPTLIFKDPGDLIRTISGTVFEDETREELLLGAARDGDGTLSGDKQIAGVKVELIEQVGNEGQGIRATTYTNSEGNYTFTYVVAGNYKIKYTYGADDKTALIKINGGQNDVSYNGESYEATKVNESLGSTPYWYEDETVRKSDAREDEFRRADVNAFYQTLRNKKAEILNSWKDSTVNRELVNTLEQESYMLARTDEFKIEVENHSKYPEMKVIFGKDQLGYEYQVKNIDFGIVERERAKLEIEKNVSYIEVISSSGEVISEGTYEDWKAGNIKHVKWIKKEINSEGFVSMEIDTELLAGARLRITYDITVKNESELGNSIENIEVIDYVTNNLNYDPSITNKENKTNQEYGWTPIITGTLVEGEPYNNYINTKSVQAPAGDKNKINIETYQTILKGTFKAGETKKLTLEKNLSSDEESDFNYENKVEIVSSSNPKGRGDYESIYGNLDPVSYTSKQGDLNWDYKQGTTQTEDHDTETINSGSGYNAIRKAEPDSGTAEEVVITAPTGTTGIVLEPIHYMLIGTCMITLIGAIYLSKKYLIR